MVLTYPPTDLTSPQEGVEGRRLHFYDKGNTIPLADEGTWQVYRGIVQVSQFAANGDEILLGWAQASAFFGMALTMGQLDTYQAKALSDVYLRWYTTAELENTPKLAQLVLGQTLKRLRQTETLLAIAGLKRVDERLQELLKLLAQEMGQPVTTGIRLSVRLTHQTLANAIGTTRVTITRLLGDLQSQGHISFDSDRHLVIHANL
jgi:CRP-like cAMP-binding protein